MSVIGYFFYLPVLAVVETAKFVMWFLQTYWWTLVIAYIFYMGSKLGR